MSAKLLRVAVGQFTASSHEPRNVGICIEIFDSCRRANLDALFLPEACDYIGSGCRPQGLLRKSMLNRVKSPGNMMWVFFGDHELCDNDSQKVYNCHVALRPCGEMALYRKIHLFDVKTPTRTFEESATTLSGKELSMPVSCGHPDAKIGLAVCFDVRFPEMAAKLCAPPYNCNVLTYPSVFTESTGRDHWEVLMRARAIDTQSFVIAANQIGRYENGRSSWGQSMIIDPWGKVLTQCRSIDDSSSDSVNGAEYEVAVAELDIALVETVRGDMPLKH